MITLALVVETTAMMGIALAVAVWMPRVSAAWRALALSGAFAMSLAMALGGAILPPVDLALPVPAPAALASPAAPRTDGSLEVLAAPDETAATPPGTLMAAARLQLLPAVWLIGIVATLIPLCRQLMRGRGVRRRSRPPAPSIGAGVAACRVDVRVSDDVLVPTAVGWRAPIVILPAAAAAWPVEHLRQALTHECEHIRRGDLAVLTMARVTTAIYWFNPVMWLAWRRLRLVVEQACDDAVVERGGHTAYAEQLVGLARTLGAGEVPGVAMAGRTDLSARVAALLDSGRSRQRLRVGTLRAAVLLMCAFGVAIAPVRVVRAASPAQDEPPRSAPVTDGPHGSIAGVVYDPTGAPLEGLLLILERNCFGPNNRNCDFNSWTRSDRQGRFAFEGLPVGSFHITSPIDFFPGTQFLINDGDAIEREITMTVLPVEAEFTVCAECAEIIVPDSLAKEFEADRADARDHPVSAPRPAPGWEYYKPARGEYPPELREAGIEGSVVVEGTISADGTLTHMKASPAGSPLARAAVAALAEELWEPGRVRGVAMEVPFRFLIRYTLKP